MQKRKRSIPEIVTDPVESARSVGLRYVRCEMPGFRRVKHGDQFRYLDPQGKPVGIDDLRRIKSLVIPPAWTDVWICPVPNGHLQATGYDARGRKQYRYHPDWRHVRDGTKYNRMVEFGKVLPKIRERVKADLQLTGLPKQKVLAAVVRLLEVSLIRVGNDEYARDNRSFGLTTLQDKHAEISGSKVRFEFRGKAGKRHSVEIDDQHLARIVKRCQDLPGQELVQYIDEDGGRQDIGSADVNAYLKEITGQDFTAKDFRTWAGTVLAARALQEFEQADSQAKAKKNIVRAVEAVAQMLGNTPSICRKCYVHPAVLDAYMDGALLQTLCRRADEKIASSLGSLRPEEAAVLAFLRNRLSSEEKGKSAANGSGRNGGSKGRGGLEMPRGALRSARRMSRVKIPAAWRS